MHPITNVLNYNIQIEDYKIYQLLPVNTCLDPQVVMAHLVPSLYEFFHSQSSHKQNRWLSLHWTLLRPKATLPQHITKLDRDYCPHIFFIKNYENYYLLIGYSLIKYLIEDELMLLNVLSKVHFVPKIKCYYSTEFFLIWYQLKWKENVNSLHTWLIWQQFIDYCVFRLYRLHYEGLIF